MIASSRPTTKPGSAAAWVNAHKPQRARFLREPAGAVGENPQSLRYHPAVKAVAAQRAPKGSLDAGGTVGGGFSQAPLARGSESAEIPAIQPPSVTANRSAPRNVGQYLSSLLKPDSKEQRRLRFDRLRMARKILRNTPLAKCMCHARDAEKGVQIVSYGEEVGYRGWKHCGSRLCPWCAAILARHDAEKAEKYARGWIKRGNAIALVHYTFRHTFDEKPRETWAIHTKVLQRLHSGSKWRAFAAEWGFREYFLGNEVTDGVNGCHKHQHRAWEILWRPEFRTATGRRDWAKRCEAAYEALYLEALRAEGRDALPGIALKLSLAAPTAKNAAKAAEYVTKFAKETMQGGLKSGHKGNKTVFELVDIAGDKSLPEAVRTAARARYMDLYWGLKGRHWTYFSEAHVAEQAEAGGEEEIPEPDLDECGDTLLHLSNEAAAMVADQDKQCWLLEYIHEHGPYAAACWLAEFTDHSHWSVEYLARFRHVPMMHWP